ncbi:hypothetical protein ISS37_01005 [candidate division KSB1 bacterium]|nr:hypothetical protein [candidate division KSB1 bacterium]
MKRTVGKLFFVTATLVVSVVFYSSCQKKATKAGSISGTISYQGSERAPIYVKAFPWPKEAQRLPDIWALEPFTTFPTIEQKELGPYTLSNIADSTYYLWIWMDVNRNGVVDYHIPEPTGWYSADRGGLDPVTMSNGHDLQNINIVLKKPTPFPEEEKRIEHGCLKSIKGKKMLHLWGTPREKGYAQGYLVGPQIRDMVEFFSVEFGARSATYYENTVIPFVESNFIFSPSDIDELDGMLHGMRDSGCDMIIEALGREVKQSDLKALNCYGEWLSLSCSSVSAWGPLTQNDELKGGLILGRDMDGEIDLRKTTVLSVLIIAIEPSSPDKKKWVSVMWPGFIGTYSGISESGVGVFTHKGNTDSDPGVTGLTPKSLIVREILETVSGENAIVEAEKIIRSFNTPAGGALGVGNILHVVSPYQGQSYPAAIFEDDYYGSVIRYPGEISPTDPHCLVCCNTFLKYQVASPQPAQWGRRYHDLIDKLTSFAAYSRTIGRQEMIDLLQTSGSRRTEHSIIFQPNQMTIDVAYEDLAHRIREAPLCQWTSYKWEELFSE